MRGGLAGRLYSRSPSLGRGSGSGRVLSRRGRSGRTSSGRGLDDGARAQPLTVLPDPTGLATAGGPLLDPPLGIRPDGVDLVVGSVLVTGLLKTTDEVVVVVPGLMVQRGGFRGRNRLWSGTGTRRRSGDRVSYIKPDVERSTTDPGLTAINIEPKMRGETARY